MIINENTQDSSTATPVPDHRRLVAMNIITALLKC